MSGDPVLTRLPASNEPLVETTRSVLATPGLPAVALVGGLAITVRVSAAGAVHRATIDIDLVTISLDPDPEAVELIASAQGSDTAPLLVDGVSVDIIPTSPVDDAELDGHDDRDRLFLTGHRWAFETAPHERLAVPGGEPLPIRVATPAGLVAAKSHAVGYPSTTRRTLKHGADLLDLLRLVELYGPGGGLADPLRSGPTHLARMVADVCDRELLTNPARAAHSMAVVSQTPVVVDDVTDVIGGFVDELRR